MNAPPPLAWMPAAAYGGKLAATFVVIHCTESDNGTGTAESLAGPNWFGGPKAGTSAHRMFDQNSGVEMVRPGTVAYHAGPGGNTYGRSYEFCGKASWTAAQWRAPEQLSELRLAAPHIAQDLIDITGSTPAAIAACRWLSVVQVARHEHGLCTHNDIRLALGGTTHSDPGPNFPYAELLGYVTASLSGTTDAPTGGFLMALTAAEQRELLDRMRVTSDQLGGPDWAHPDPKKKSWGWPHWRFNDKKTPPLTMLDYLRAIDQQLNSPTDAGTHPDQAQDVAFGQILSLRNDLRRVLERLDELAARLPS